MKKKMFLDKVKGKIRPFVSICLKIIKNDSMELKQEKLI